MRLAAALRMGGKAKLCARPLFAIDGMMRASYHNVNLLP